MAVEISGDTTPPVVADFWRGAGSATELPDVTGDETQGINRTGRMALGNVQTRTPVALFDLALGGRSGADERTAATAFYATAALPGLAVGPALPTPAPVVEFRHSNQTQGVGVAFNGLYATGTATSGDFILQQRGAGVFRRHYQALNAQNVLLATERADVDMATGHGFLVQHIDRTRVLGNEYVYGEANGFRRQFDIFGHGTTRVGLRIQPQHITPVLANADPEVVMGGDFPNPRKIVLYGGANTGAGAAFSLGIESSTMTFNVPAATQFFRWKQNDTVVAMQLQGNGNLTLAGTATKPGGGSWAAPSDSRLKQSVVPITNGLERILALRPKEFSYKPGVGYGNATFAGLIAQDAQVDAPSLVRTNIYPAGSPEATTAGATTVYGIDPSAILYWLIGAVQQLAGEDGNPTGPGAPAAGGCEPSLVGLDDLTVTGTVHNLAAPATQRGYRFSGASDLTVTGMAQAVHGTCRRFLNVSTQAVKVKHEDPGSLVANRVHCPENGDYEIKRGAYAQFTYDATSSRWRLLIAGEGE